MRKASANLNRLINAAELLRPLLEELVFVGGSVTGLLITDEAAADPRVTVDVDAIAAITSYAEYAAFSARLRALNFSEDNREVAPLCRWLQGNLIFDVMPLDSRVIGFTNRWYRTAMATATWEQISDTVRIRMITAPLFIATKLEAFSERAKGNLWLSQDLEDIVSVVDGRPDLATEIEKQGTHVKSYIRSELSKLLEMADLADALPAYFLPDAASQARIDVVLRRLRALAS